DKGMSVLRYLVPVLAGAAGEIQGRMAMDVYLRGRGESRDVLCKSLVGNGGLDLDLNSLTSFRLRGNVDRVAITAAGTTADGRSPLEQIIGPEDRERLRVLGRQFRDKLMR